MSVSCLNGCFQKIRVGTRRLSGGGNPYADAKIRASLSLNVKNARKAAQIAWMVLASQDPRDFFIVVVSRVWIGLTDTRNTELRCLLAELPEFVSGSVTAYRARRIVVGDLRGCILTRFCHRLRTIRLVRKRQSRFHCIDVAYSRRLERS